eukprot:TRINITY_DN44269_c0_g1_i1.p1 TRINITY_DN44269_c0_g1~~TRINITY_DN44269_c0_g1_i1.p1  ORF type:complete len:670 (-),score=5.90 TRINITY_DN44269_c0_g1_i1:47-2056(-)
MRMPWQWLWIGVALMLRCVAQDHGVQAVRLSVSPSSIKSGTWVTVSFNGVPSFELSRPSTEYICVQDSYCKDVQRLSLWVGVFGKDADRTAIGPQSWACGNPPWLATSPIKWKPLNTSSGEVNFHMEAGRHSELEFVLFSNGTTWPIELATSNSLKIEDHAIPRHLRLARTSSESEMRVTWSGMELHMNTSVRWGLVPGNYSLTTPAMASTYQKSELCGPPATTHGWAPAPWTYTAVLSSLPRAPARVFYTVGSDAMGWSEERSFHVPEPAAANQTLRALVLADMGETYVDGAQYHWMEPFAINTTSFAFNDWNGPGLVPMALNPAQAPLGQKAVSGKEGAPRGKVMTKLTAMAASHAEKGTPTNLVLHIGDLSYATGYETEWDYFMTQIEVLASQAPYMTTEGNHERDYPGSGNAVGGSDSGGECGIPTEARFLMPTPDPVRTSGWYSFDQGPVHFLVMATEMSAELGSAQMAFFERDLSGVDRGRTPWVVVMGHRPMYSSTDNPKGINKELPWWPDVEKVFVKYEVDLCMWGHVHNAEVTCPVINGSCVGERAGEYSAPIHAVIGNGGQSLTRFCTNSTGTCCCSSVGPTCKEACDAVPSWSEWRMDSFGFASLEVQGSTRLTMNFHQDCDGEFDGVTMKGCKRYDVPVHTLSIERRASSTSEQIVV